MWVFATVPARCREPSAPEARPWKPQHLRRDGALVQEHDLASPGRAYLENMVARQILDSTGAFVDPNEADSSGIRLTLPAVGGLPVNSRLPTKR